MKTQLFQQKIKIFRRKSRSLPKRLFLFLFRFLQSLERYRVMFEGNERERCVLENKLQVALSNLEKY